MKEITAGLKAGLGAGRSRPGVVDEAGAADAGSDTDTRLIGLEKKRAALEAEVERLIRARKPGLSIGVDPGPGGEGLLPEDLDKLEVPQAMAFLVRLTPVGNVAEIVAGLVQAKRALDKGDVKGALLSLGAATLAGAAGAPGKLVRLIARSDTVAKTAIGKALKEKFPEIAENWMRRAAGSIGAGPAKTAAKVTRQALNSNVPPAAAVAAGVAAGVARKTIETVREKVLKKAGVKGFQVLGRQEQEQIRKLVRTEAAGAVATLGVKISDDLLSGVVNEEIREFVEGK